MAEQERVVITDLTYEGLGVGRVNNLVMFVYGAVIGDELLVNIRSRKKRFCYAEIEQILVPSPDRVDPLCSAAGKCGGCQLQTVAYDAQMRWKHGYVVKTLQRARLIDDMSVEQYPATVPIFYRNRAQAPVRNMSGQVTAGFFAQGSHNVVPIRRCLIQHPAVDDAVRGAVDLVREMGWQPYDEVSGTGELRHVAARCGTAGDTLVTLVVRTGRPAGIDKYVNLLTTRRPRISTVAVNENPDKTNVIFGDRTRVEHGSGTVDIKLGAINFPVNSTSFFQVNSEQAQKLCETAVSWAEAGPGVKLVDLYAGMGPIGCLAAARGAEVIAIERSESAVVTGKQVASQNGLHVQFVTGDAGDVLSERAIDADVIVVDPPRRGCDTSVLGSIVRAGVPRLVYVSCNPATLARDAAELCRHGYEVDRVAVVDMFPQTSHVECVVLLSRVDK